MGLAGTDNALSPQGRERAIDVLSSGDELDLLVIGGGVVGSGTALDSVTRGLSTGLIEQRDFASGTSSRSSKLIHGGLRYLEMLDFALVREALHERGLLLTRLAPHLVRPVPFLYPLTHHGWERVYVGSGHRALRRHGHELRHRRGSPPPPAPHPTPGAAPHAEPQEQRPHRCRAVLRRPGRRRPSHDGARPHRRQLWRPRREPRCCHWLPASGRARHGRACDRQAHRPRVRDQRQADRQRDRGVDRRHPGDGRRARAVPRPRLQGHPPRGAPRPHPLLDRTHPAHREVGALRHPVGPALDPRHHRHRLGARQGPPGRHPRRHRLHPRPRQPRAGDAADPRGRRGRLRRAAPPARGRVRVDEQAVPRARGRPQRPRPGRRGRRQVHDLPRDGQGRRRRGGPGHPRPDRRLDDRDDSPARRGRLPGRRGTSARPSPAPRGCTSPGSSTCFVAMARSPRRSSTSSPSTPSSRSPSTAPRTTSRQRSSTPPRTRAPCTSPTS